MYEYAYRGNEVERFGIVRPDAKTIYPYVQGEDRKAKLIEEKKLESNFPNIYQYLLSRKEVLSERKDSRKYYAKGEDWYCYLRPGSFDYINPEKLIIQGVATESTVGHLNKDTIFNGANCPGYIHNQDQVSQLFLLALVNSRLISEYLKQVCPSKLHGYTRFNANNLNNIPIREINFTTPKAERKQQVKDLINLYQDELSVLDTVDELLSGEVGKFDVIHDFLAFLAKQMLDYNNEKQRLQSALDPFKFLNKGVTFKKFSDVFSEAIKYGQQLTKEIDIGTVHHDIEGLRLEPEHSADDSKSSDESKKHPWLLRLHLKHRDPETDWADWIKEDGSIVRSTASVFRFSLSQKEARYWQQAFEVLEEFENSSTFPGGKTRTTHEKLMKTKVPVFDDSANIQPLIELREELAKVEEKIEKTDGLIDQVVYQLYGLSEEEIKVVEGS